MYIDRKKLNSARGALVGLACGDALGTTLEFEAPGSFEPIDDMRGGGPFGLAKGQWTDDTSMALCLAASLVEQGRCDPVDQLQRYVRWRDEGYMSCTGTCFDIGNTVNAALHRFEKSGKAASGSTDKSKSGNGALMRMAPAILFNSTDMNAARIDARVTTVTTHGSAFCTETSDLFAVLLWLAINGSTKDQVIDDGVIAEWIDPAQLQPEVAAIMNGSFKQNNPPDIRGTGFVVQSLEAALWALYHHDDFETGALAAANLGDDADTTAAIYGQLAGAIYGYDAIPAKWRKQIALHQEINDLADALFLGVTPQLMEESLRFCESLSADPEVGALASLMPARDPFWFVENRDDFTTAARTDEEQFGGLVELAVNMSGYVLCAKLFDGPWDWAVADGRIPRFLSKASQQLRRLMALIADGQP